MRESSRSCCGRRSTPRSKRRRRDSLIRYAWKSREDRDHERKRAPRFATGWRERVEGEEGLGAPWGNMWLAFYPRTGISHARNRWEDTSSSRMYLSPLKSFPILFSVFFFLFCRRQFLSIRSLAIDERNWRNREEDDSCFFHFRSIRVWDGLRFARFRRVILRPVFLFVNLFCTMCSRPKGIISGTFYLSEQENNKIKFPQLYLYSRTCIELRINPLHHRTKFFDSL